MDYRKEQKNDFLQTPLWDSRLSLEERLDALVKEMTEDEKLKCLTTGCPDIPRLGITGFYLGGEAAHGIEARHDQDFNRGEPEPTTSFPQPIGMSASWDREMLKNIGTAVGEEARVLYQRNRNGGLCRWAPTIDMERDPRWGRTEEAYGEDPFLTGEMAGAYIRGMRGDDPFYLRCGATLKHFYGNNQEKDRVRTSSSIDPRNKKEYYLEPFRRAVEAGAEAVMTSYNEINGVPAIVNPEVQELFKDAWGLPGHVVCDGGDMQQTVTEHHYFQSHAETVAYGLKAGVDCFTDDGKVVEAAAREALERGLITWEDVDRSIRNSFRTRIRLGLYDRQGDNPYREIPEERLNSPEHTALARKAVRESAVLLKNEAAGSVPAADDPGMEKCKRFLPLEPGQKIAVIGPWADVWYKDWYSGVPLRYVTVKEGIVKSGMAAEVRSFDGYDRIRIRTDRGWLCVQSDGTVTEGEKERAEIFRLEDWGSGQYLLFGEQTGRYLTTEESGKVTVSKKEAFGWFIREAVHFKEQADGTVRMESWDGKLLGLDESGRLGCVSEKDGAAGFSLDVVSDGEKEAEKLAQWADVVIYAAGCNPVINSKEEIDREDLDMPRAQEEQLLEIASINPRTMLLLICNYPYAIGRIQEEIPAILQCASGSQELGNGLADLLFGKASPAGRLPMTWYRSTEDLPPMEDYDIIRGKRTYQYFDRPVLYPFGYGLSYTEFAYSGLDVTLEETEGKEKTLRISLTVKNTGTTVSDEVVQIYVRQNTSRAPRPRKQLKAFERVGSLPPEEERRVEFSIPLKELEYYDVVTERMVLEEGSYTILAGASSEDIRLERTLSIGGVKIPPRNAESVTKADHYDDCKGAVLYQGHDSKCAVYAKTETAELLYRDFVFEKTPRKIHVLFQGEGSGTVELYAAEQGLCTGEPETAAESENICGAVLKKNLLLRQNCDNSGKPVWKEYLLNEDAVENLPTGKKMDLLIRLKGGAGIAEYCFSD